MNTATRAAIPQCLAHRPTQGGLVVPAFVLSLPDGTHDFAACEGLTVNRMMLDRICGVCGYPITGGRVVFFAGDDQLDEMLFDAVPMCPPCAAYSAKACPMVAGHRTSYRTAGSRASTTHQACGKPGCDCGGYAVSEDRERGLPAPTWFAVWCRDYACVASSAAAVAAIRAGRPVPGERFLAKVDHPLRVREVAS